MSLRQHTHVERVGLENEYELIERAKSDPDAFAPVYEFYRPMVHCFVLPLVDGDHAAAEDVTTETFMATLRHLDKLRPGPGWLRTWLFTVARRRAINHQVKRRAIEVRRVDGRRVYQARPITALNDELPVPDPRLGAEELMVRAIERAELRRTLARALAKLSPVHRRLLEVRYLEGLTQAEAGAELGLGKGRMARNEGLALAAMRAVLEKAGGPAELEAA